MPTDYGKQREFRKRKSENYSPCHGSAIFQMSPSSLFCCRKSDQFTSFKGVPVLDHGSVFLYSFLQEALVYVPPRGKGQELCLLSSMSLHIS